MSENNMAYLSEDFNDLIDEVISLQQRSTVLTCSENILFFLIDDLLASRDNKSVSNLTVTIDGSTADRLENYPYLSLKLSELVDQNYIKLYQHSVEKIFISDFSRVYLFDDTLDVVYEPYTDTESVINHIEKLNDESSTYRFCHSKYPDILNTLEDLGTSGIRGEFSQLVTSMDVDHYVTDFDQFIFKIILLSIGFDGGSVKMLREINSEFELVSIGSLSNVVNLYNEKEVVNLTDQPTGDYPTSKITIPNTVSSMSSGSIVRNVTTNLSDCGLVIES